MITQSEAIIAAFNYDWGLQQAKSFAVEFSEKWVEIDTDNMNANEIKLLVRVACFFEKKEQEKESVYRLV